MLTFLAVVPMVFCGRRCRRNDSKVPYLSQKPFFSSFSFVVSKIISIFATNMISRQECIDRILANKNTIVEDYDVRSLRLFGSVARNEQKESSDVDVFVEMEPDIFQIIGLKEFLENLLGCSVDVVRKHRNNNEFLLKQIEKDGIDIIREPANRFAYA